jgi:hypothetical protein
MFRNITLALAAATVVAITAIPTTASAHYTGYRHSHGYRHHHCYTVKRWVHTRWGWQRIKVRRCR